MIYFDRSMDLIEYLQSRKRLHRIGAENEVIQHNLIVENSVDEQVDKMLRDKEFLNTKLLNKKYFDIKDLEELFGDFK
jgi:SNF2 family DNA or RNA helicase